MTRAFLLLAAVAVAAGAQPARIDLEVGAGVFRVEVADTPDTRRIGLSGREAIAPDGGMLFVYRDDAVRCMWMRETHVPLAVAFLDGAGRVINIAEMTPRTDHHHCSERPARWVLELPAGSFARLGIGAGDSIGGLRMR